MNYTDMAVIDHCCLDFVQLGNTHLESLVVKYGITLKFRGNQLPIQERFFHAMNKQFMDLLKGDNPNSSNQ